MLVSCIVVLSCIASQRGACGDEPPRFELKDGDRIVFVGDTFIERDQRYGYLETLLSISNPDKNLVFRNLGWSGDTIAGVSRSGFDPPEAGFEQLRQQILAVKPTVVVVGYGMADSFAGEAGLPAFEQGMNRLLNVIDSLKARVVFLSPVAHAKLPPPLPDPTNHNQDLKRYRDAIKHIAKARSAPFVDLFADFDELYRPKLQHDMTETPTENGIHLNEFGYWFAALAICQELDQNRPATSQVRDSPDILQSLVLRSNGKVESQMATSVSQFEKTADGLRFELTSIPRNFFVDVSTRWGAALLQRLEIRDLPPGQYELKIDGKSAMTASARQWETGVAIGKIPGFEQAQALRAAINRKNDLFFYKWRPQNITYLTGFRKHEQGNNAVEIARFDPLIAEQEKLIARLKKPVPHRYEISRVEKEVAK